MPTATAIAHPNIALVKYWGKRDAALNLPAVPSLSLTLDTFTTTTTVTWGAPTDAVRLDGRDATAEEARRVLELLDLLDPQRPAVAVDSHNDFPTAAGLASSSSGFAALVVAAVAASGADLDVAAQSVLARRGSGSACRSLFGGFVRWRLGTREDGTDSRGEPVAPPDHWDVAMVVAVVSGAKKPIGSRVAMQRSAATSPYYPTWVQTAPDDVARGVDAVRRRDLTALGRVMEASTFKMHATMHTSDPPVNYWQPATVACLAAVEALRADGVGAWATMDAGPNVKVLCAREDADRVARALGAHVDTVRVLGPGGAPRVVA